MTKLRKMMMAFVFVFAVVLGSTAGTNNAKAATTKNFKGKLNVTYKNSDCKITIKKVNSKKVSIQGIYSGLGFDDKVKYIGKITSKNTIKFSAVNSKEAYVDVIFKWKDKSHFTSIWKEKRSTGLKYCSDTLPILFDGVKYTQVKKSSTVYYSSKGNPYKSVISIKGNKAIVKGKLTKGTKKSYGEAKGTVTKLKSKTRTFTFAKNIKFYGNGGEDPNPSRIPYNDAISLINNKEGLDKSPFVLTVKNGKVTRIDFYS